MVDLLIVGVIGGLMVDGRAVDPGRRAPVPPGEARPAGEEDAARRLRGTSALRPSLDVGLLKSRKLKTEDARREAGRRLQDILRSGDAYEAVHVMTYARITKDRELLSAIRQRLTRSDESWGEQHVRLGAMHALIVMENEKFPDEIAPYLKSEDVSLKVRAFMLARDSKDASLKKAVIGAVDIEKDLSVRAAGLSALSAMEGKNSVSRRKVLEMAESSDEPGSRAKIELAQIGGDQSESAAPLTPEDEEKFKQMAVSAQHDQRMYAIEMIATNGSEGSRGWLKRLGQKEDWRLRLTSAYYLLQAREFEEARRRVAEETHPLVQVTLLATLRVPEPAK